MNSDGYSRAPAAEAAFYAAFEIADLAAMMNVWDQADDIEGTHQPGKRIAGVEAAAESWRWIFSGEKRMQFQLSDIYRYSDGRLVTQVLY